MLKAIFLITSVGGCIFFWLKVLCYPFICFIPIALSTGLVSSSTISLSLWSTARMKTFSANSATAENKWYVVDAANLTLGRLATELARRLRGKHKPIYTPHVDTGDYIVVVNAEKITVTGNKSQSKIYYHNTGYPGGMKSIVFKDLLAKKPTGILELAVKGMLPRGPLGRKMFKKLKLYAGNVHPHQAQNPESLTIK